jgi:hypothetical protein
MEPYLEDEQGLTWVGHSRGAAVVSYIMQTLSRPNHRALLFESPVAVSHPNMRAIQGGDNTINHKANIATNPADLVTLRGYYKHYLWASIGSTVLPEVTKPLLGLGVLHYDHSLETMSKTMRR